MDWRTRVAELQRWGSYRSAVQYLEQVSEELSSPVEQAEALFSRASLLDEVFLRRVEAADAYLNAYQLDTSRSDALRRARFIHRSLGLLTNVSQSIEHELGTVEDPVLAADLLKELGDVYQDLGELARAQESYSRILTFKPDHEPAGECLQDVMASEVEAHTRMQELAAAGGRAQGHAAAAVLVRAGRIARRLGDVSQLPFLEAAVRATPMAVEPAMLVDGAYAETGDLQGLRAFHDVVISRVEDPRQRCLVAVDSAARWLNRFQEPETAAAMLQRAAEADPTALAPHVGLGEYWQAQEDWSKTLDLLDAALERGNGQGGPAELWLLTEATEVAWQKLQDVTRAGEYARKLRERAPGHPSVEAFFQEHGDAVVAPSPVRDDLREAPVSEQDMSGSKELDFADAEPGGEEPAEEASPQLPDEAIEAPPVEEALPETDALATGGDAEIPARELTGEEQAQIAELDDQLEKFEGQKRWTDYIRTLLAKADIVIDTTVKIELMTQAGNLYIERSSNQAEAIKCFERVMELDSRNVEAITRLKEMYEKRRDWERLVRTMQAEAELLDPDDRPLRYVEMAHLATERLRKPDICIELWQLVLGVDPDNPDALGALANLYERAREWQPLAQILEKHVEQISDEKELKTQLQKLGMIYADKLNEDAGAVRAFRKLLTLDPDDRRAQEQLKRRYVSLKSWDELEEFFGSTDKWDELIRILEREADSKEAPTAERIDLLFRAARLWETRKEKPDRAARAYEKILETDSDNLEAAEALSPIYEQANDARKLVNVYEVRLRHMEDPQAKITLLRETGLLYEERLRDPKTAFERFLEAFATEPSQEVVREDVDRLAAVVDGWDRVILAYNTAIDRAPTEDEQIELRMNFGRVLTTVGKVEDAIAQYRAVYDASSDHNDAIAALGDLYRQTERYEDLLEIYGRRMDLETDLDVRRQLAYQRASLWEEELRNPDKAIDSYREILEEYGEDEVDAFRALDRLYEAQGRWRDFAGTLERRIDLGPPTPEELAALKFRLARALEQHLDDKPQAVELYREVLTILPEHDGARAALEALLDDEAVRGQAAEILEPTYEVRGEWENLIRTLHVLHDVSDDPVRRLDLLTKVGEVYGERIGDFRKSFEAFCDAFRETPDSFDTLARLEVLAVEQERFKDLVSLISELASAVSEPDLSRTLWIKAADIDDTQLGDVDGAVGSYRRVLDQDPGDLEVLGALEALYRRTERWRDLLGVLRKRVELTGDPDEKEELLSQMAFIHDEMLTEPLQAITQFKEILDLNPTSTGALSALDALYAGQEMYSDLADNVDRQLSMATDPDQQIGLMLRLADLRERRMNEVESAIEGYREVLDRGPSNETALGALERLIERDEHQLLIAEILEPIYRDSNQFEKLISVHEIQARHASSPDRRVELLHRIAELYELALDDLGSAFMSHARALAEDPASETTQDSLARLAAITANYEALAQVYEERVQSVEDPQLASSLHVKAALVREEQLGDAAGAIGHYQRVLQLDSQHLGAATALERLFQLSERYEDLAHIYMTKAAMLDSPDEQKEYFFRAAAIYEEILERPLDAIGVFDRILEVDPEELRALDKLIELYLRLERWEDLLRAYTRKADIVADPEEKKRLYVEMGAVYEREVGDIEKAIDTYQRILEIDPDDMTAISRLDALYQATENWQELLSVLEREADLATDPNEVISYRYRIAALWHHRLSDPLRAVDIYRDILEVIPDHGPTLDALESMVSEGREAVAAAGVLEPVYRQVGEWAKLISVHEVQIAHEEDPVRRVELLHQVAELYEFQLDQTQQAFQAFSRALPLDNENEHTLGSLERLAENLNAWVQVTSLYDVEIGKLQTEAPDRLVDMALRTAQIYEVQVGDVNAAIDRYRIVVEADEGHVQAIEALDRLFEATERWAELADVLRKEIAVATSPDDILSFQFRLGRVYQEQLGQVEEAIEQYREILAAAPEHTPAMSSLELLFAEGIRPLVVGEILEPLYRMQAAFDKLLNVHEVQLNYQGDAVERVSMMHRIAEIAEERANDHVRAFAWMQRALLEDPAHDHSQAEVERLASILDGWAQLANTYADVVEHGSDPETRVLIGKRLARVYAEELGDVQRAEETYRYVLSIDDHDGETLEALDQIYVEHGAHEALAEILRKRIVSSDHPDDLVRFNYRLGQVLEHELGRTDEAIQVYSHVLGELETEHHDSIRSLQRIYTSREDWPNLFNAFERELNVVVGDQAQSEILAKMARLASEALTDPNRAIDLWRRVLDLRGEDPEALNAVGDIYSAQENWADLVDVLEREVGIATDDDLRVAIFSDLGRIWYEKLGRERNSLDNWERVLDIDPTNTYSLFAIAEIHRAAKQYHELVDTLNRVIDVGAATLDDAQIEHVYMQLGYLYATEMQQPMDAVDSYNRVLDVSPGNFQSMDALEHIHRTEAMWEDCIQVMERRYQALQTAREKTPVLLSIARMWADQVGNADEGTSAYQRILELEPMNQHAFEKLEALHSDAARWEDLIEMYLARAESSEDTRERVELLRKIAAVYEKRLDDKDQAYEALKIAWTEDFADRETSGELERLAAATQKWNDLLTSANEALASVEDSETKIAICLHCAKWYGQELGHPEYAIPYYQQIQTLDPGNVASMQQLAELYRTTQQWQLLAQTLGQLVQLTTDPLVKADTFVQMGELCETHLGVPDQATGYYTKALEENAKNLGALQALERIYRGDERWDDLLDILRRKADALTDPEEILDARLQIAETFEYRLVDVDDAITTYRHVLDGDPVNLAALKGLERLYGQKGQWPDLLGVLEKQFDVVTIERERIDILMRLSTMWEGEFVKPEKAAERLEQVLDIDPSNDAALTGLERLYRNMQRWENLIATYERHVSATPDRAEKTAIFKAMGETYAHELDDDDRAVDAYLNVLDLDEDNMDALDALTRLYDKRGEHSSALDMMEKIARLSNDPEQQVDLRFRMGRILDEQLGDRAAAIDHFQSAIDLEPAHLPSLEAMRKIHIDTGDWLSASRVLEQESQYQENPRLVAQLLVDLGQIYEERLDEHDRAIEVFEAALRQDPDSEEAAQPLADEYYKEKRWPEAFPLLQMLVKRSGKLEPDEQHRLSFMLGDVATQVGDDEEAIKAYNKAYQLDSTHLPSLLGLAGGYYRTKEWDKAFKFYQMLLVHHRDSLGSDETTDIFYRLGVIKREQGERRKALNMFDKALEEDQYHRLTLEAVIGLYESQNEWEQVIHFKKQILEVAKDDEERLNFLEQIGDLWKEKVGNQQKAIQSYSEACDIDPESHRLLHKLLQSYQETRQWEKAIEVIQQVSALDDRMPAKSKYSYTVAVIVRDELKDSEAAIERFNEALDQDSDNLKAFEAINKLLTQKKDWKQLERAFRKMLHRIVGKERTELEFNLWHNLGVIYRDRQKQFDNAAEAFRMASSLQPDNSTEHQILAELYAMVPERVQDAIGEHQWLLRQDPYKIDSYRALYRLYFDARAYDKAWCLAATLTFLKKADNEQQQFYQQYKQGGMIRPQSRVDNERWVKDLFHPNEDLFVSKILEACAPAIHALKSSSDKALHLSKKHEVDPASSTVTFARTFGFVSQVLNLGIVPRLFLRPDAPGGLTFVPGSNPPSSVCGATLLSGFTPIDLTFVIARHLSYYRGEHFIRTLLGTHTELRMILLAGMRIGGTGPADPQVDATAQQLVARLGPAQIEALRSVSKRFMEAGAKTDLKAWMQAVELTGCRAGFLLANDLETAARMIQSLPPEGPTDSPPKEKIKEIVLFSVSEEYFRLREALGITIAV